MRWSAGGPVSGRQFSEFQGRARAFAGPISTVIRQFSFWQGTDRFDSGRRPVDTIYVMCGRPHEGRGVAVEAIRLPANARVSQPSSDAFNAEHPRDEEPASGRILWAPQGNSEES